MAIEAPADGGPSNSPEPDLTSTAMLRRDPLPLVRQAESWAPASGGSRSR
jgi:hypothetical protein